MLKIILIIHLSRITKYHNLYDLPKILQDFIPVLTSILSPLAAGIILIKIIAIKIMIIIMTSLHEYLRLLTLEANSEKI